MTASTQGLELSTGSRPLRSAVELLSSMRFAISLLTLICIASVIGTVLKQNEPFNNYVNQFGPFWAEVFAVVGLYSLYSAWWFLLILAFLVTSTALCIARHTPKILADLRTCKENIRVQSLQAFGLRAQATLDETPERAARRIGQLLAAGGWSVKLQHRDSAGAGPDGGGWMVAAKAGSVNKIGYLAAHSAIVLVCLGGLLDGDLMVRAQMWLSGKSVYNGGGLISEVKPAHRLSASNPAFRGNLVVAEGAQSSTVVLGQSGGILLQELPFSVELKKFVVEYYATGMPKLFASDILIHDSQSGAAIPARVAVNHPVSYQGVDIYQSGFDDGGSRVKLKAVPMNAAVQSFDVEGVIGGSSPINSGPEKMTLEYTGLRVVNVENFAGSEAEGLDVRQVDLREFLQARLGAANKVGAQKDWRNVGPSIAYKLRDAAGQAREFHNYMQPVSQGDGVSVFLMGWRDSAAEPFGYLRVPVDEQGGYDAFFNLRLALADPATRALAVQRYVAHSVDASRADLKQPLTVSATRALALFAGAVAGKDGKTVGGLPAIADFIETRVPEAERATAGEVLIRILHGALFELAQVSRQRAGLKPFESNEKTKGFMTQAVLSLSEAQVYPAPMVLQLSDFTQVQASVFQVTRAPGKKVVYLGCALLIFGVFAMLYVRERRLWVWLAPQGDQAEATMALSSNRKTMDGDREFEQLKSKLIGIKEQIT
jgi:cytochrome c biogenesis protein